MKRKLDREKRQVEGLNKRHGAAMSKSTISTFPQTLNGAHYETTIYDIRSYPRSSQRVS